VWKQYGKAIKAVVNSYRKGTFHNIHMLENGLIYCGEPGDPVTWMDAMVDGKAVTLRRGCPVEINALWYNAVMFTASLADAASDASFSKTWKKLGERVRESFVSTFWDDEKGYLADVVDNGNYDWSVRPNQIIAAAVPFSPLTQEMITAVITIVSQDLLTPRGLRTLSPRNPNYLGSCEGNQEARDRAYHQGTVWPWLLEHYCEAYIKIYGNQALPIIKKILDEFEPAIHEHGVGAISELYNGDPPHAPGGTISQAWSVAALLRIIMKTEELESSQDE
jgi:predicted glycogen debranching enzyme